MPTVSNTWGRRGDASDSRIDARSCQVCHHASNVPAEQIFFKSLLDLRKKRQIFKLLLDRCVRLSRRCVHFGRPLPLRGAGRAPRWVSMIPRSKTSQTGHGVYDVPYFLSKYLDHAGHRCIQHPAMPTLSLLLTARTPRPLQRAGKNPQGNEEPSAQKVGILTGFHLTLEMF